ncbi:leucyl/phenylalanyl-tRNA--protein transferase [Pseudomonadota bacterium]
MLYLLDPRNPDAPFPSANQAEKEPNGLLAVGGELSPTRLLSAYRHGIFPWYSEGQPILWWSPDPRTVLFPEHLKLSRSLRKTLRKQEFSVSIDMCYEKVIQACAEPRDGDEGTWITPAMATAYTQMHELGHAHSVETWRGSELVGGLYGIAIGKVFFGESMFSRATDASKVALAHLVSRLTEWGFRLIDCQVYSQHLISLGAEEISREDFIQHLDDWCELPGHMESWRGEPRYPTEQCFAEEQPANRKPQQP